MAVGGSPDLLWVRLDPWAMQAFDCYNWDPGKGIGLAFATDNDLCCLENAGAEAGGLAVGAHGVPGTPPDDTERPQSRIEPPDV